MLNKNHVLVLHDIRSVYNVGAIFRTADAIGISKIYLTGYTPTPLDRFGRVRNDVAKSALGAEKTVAWEYAKDLESLLKNLKGENKILVGVEQDPRSISCKEIKNKFPESSFAFIFGNEVEGISKETLDLCDVIAEIPMRGKKESLNVSVAAGIVLYGVLD